MKKITQLLLIALLVQVGPFGAFAECFGPNNRFRFNETLDQLTVVKSEQSKLRIGIAYINDNCFTTNQLIKMMDYLRYDADRVILAKQAFPNVSDRKNFNFVFHHIDHLDHKRDLREFVRHQRGRNQRLDFPRLAYPNAERYRGTLGANSFINERLFSDLAYNILDARNDQHKFSLVNKYARNYELNVAQFMKMLTLVNVPIHRLDLAVNNHHLLYDRGNVRYIENVFQDHFLINRFRTAIRPAARHQGVAHGPRYTNRNRSNTRYRNARMEPNRKEMDQLIFTLRNETFDSKRLVLAKAIIKSHGYFTTQQIGFIMRTFTFEKYKLEIARFAYPFSVNSVNYYMLTNELTYASSRKQLNQFLINQ